MKSIAITGGIGSGKSTVTDHLITKGYIVIDADDMARKLTAPGGESIPYILEKFGASYIAKDGSMDRAKMRDLVFKDPEAKKILEQGTTNVVISKIEEIRNNAEAAGEKLMFFDIPLLFETNRENDYDEIWVVTAPTEVRKARVIKRDGISEDIADLIIGSQSEEEYRVSKADLVLHNDSTVESLYADIDEELKKYK